MRARGRGSALRAPLAIALPAPPALAFRVPDPHGDSRASCARASHLPRPARFGVTAASVAGRSAESQGQAPRFVDRGAVFAGWVGLGTALVIAIAFELILAIQSLVFIIALPAGMLIGGYANAKSERWRPMRRVFANAAYAALVTGVGLALMYAVLRLVFVFADTGSLPDGTSMTCQAGPACTYQRYVRDGQAQALADAGVTDGASFGAYAINEQLRGGAIILVVTVAGAVVAAGWRSVRPMPATKAA